MPNFTAKDAIVAIRQAGHGTLAALRDWFNGELEDARLEMECASDPVALWRAQGRIAELRALLAVIRIKERE